MLLVPLVAVNKQENGSTVARAIGVVRCRNKKLVAYEGQAPLRPYFTDDDAAIVSAVCQAAVPHIDTLLRDEGLMANIAGMTHELNMPVNTLQAAFDRVHTLIARGDYKHLSDLEEDMISWTGLMCKIIDMVDLFGRRNRPLEPECERIGLFGDVIAPLKPVMKKLLDNRRFSVDRIRYAPFETLPLLYLDRNLFQMVFFNLFSNAIKYAFDDPGQFEVRIDAEQVGGEFRIHFSDYGPGIDEAYAKSIFEHGMRGPTALSKIVKGMGLGLWVVRRVVEAHEGHVEVTSFHQPTTITISLPEARRSSAPPKIKKGKLDRKMARILVLDDEPEALKYWWDDLEEAGFIVVRTTTVEQAILRSNADHYDLMVLDRMLPPGRSIRRVGRSTAQRRWYKHRRRSAWAKPSGGCPRHLPDQLPERRRRYGA